MTAPLAEVVEEGRRLENEHSRACAENRPSDAEYYYRNLVAFKLEHFDRLLAVAAAAVEMREATKFYFGRHSIESDADGGSVRLANAASAFDAAARGEK